MIKILKGTFQALLACMVFVCVGPYAASGNIKERLKSEDITESKKAIKDILLKVDQQGDVLLDNFDLIRDNWSLVLEVLNSSNHKNEAVRKFRYKYYSYLKNKWPIDEIPKENLSYFTGAIITLGYCEHDGFADELLQDFLKAPPYIYPKNEAEPHWPSVSEITRGLQGILARSIVQCGNEQVSNKFLNYLNDEDINIRRMVAFGFAVSKQNEHAKILLDHYRNEKEPAVRADLRSTILGMAINLTTRINEELTKVKKDILDKNKEDRKHELTDELVRKIEALEAAYELLTE